MRHTLERREGLAHRADAGLAHAFENSRFPGQKVALSYSWPARNALGIDICIDEARRARLRLIQFPRFARAAARKKWTKGEFRLSSILRRSLATASSSAPRANLAPPQNAPKPGKCREEKSRASFTWASVSRARPIKILRGGSRMSSGQVRIQDQCALEFGNGLIRTPGLVQDAAQSLVGQWIICTWRKHLPIVASAAVSRALDHATERMRPCWRRLARRQAMRRGCLDQGPGRAQKTARLRHVFKSKSKLMKKPMTLKTDTKRRSALQGRALSDYDRLKVGEAGNDLVRFRRIAQGLEALGRDDCRFRPISS